MRADAHYVEQLSARSGDQPLRSIAIEEIEATGSPVADDLQALVRSIAAHGIVQPLIVRRDGDGYRLIAGRKRLTAARAELTEQGWRVLRVWDFEVEADPAEAAARVIFARGRSEADCRLRGRPGAGWPPHPRIGGHRHH
jgi:hypothetical protein